MQLTLKNKIEKQHRKYQKKYWRSKCIYIIVNILIMVITVTLSVVTARAIQTNLSNPNKWLFLAIMILNILITFLSSINTLFLFERIINKNKDKIETMLRIQEKAQEYSSGDLVDQLIEAQSDFD